MGGMLEMCNARLYRFWGSLTEALRTGELQSEVKTGGGFFETLYADPEKLAQFAGDERPSTAAGQAIAAKFPGATTAVSSTSVAPRARCRSRSRRPMSI